MKVKAKATEVVTTGKRIVTNAEALVQALSMAWLFILAVLLLNNPEAVVEMLKRSEYQWLTAISAAVMGVRAFIEFVKFLDK